MNLDVPTSRQGESEKEKKMRRRNLAYLRKRTELKKRKRPREMKKTVNQQRSFLDQAQPPVAGSGGRGSRLTRNEYIILLILIRHSGWQAAGQASGPICQTWPCSHPRLRVSQQLLPGPIALPNQYVLMSPHMPAHALTPLDGQTTIPGKSAGCVSPPLSLTPA